MSEARGVDSRQAVVRLLVTLLLMTVGSSGMYVVSVMLPSVQAEFGIERAEASLPYTALMIGFGIGGVAMGRLADRFGVMWPLLLGAVALGIGYVACGTAHGIVAFTIAQGLLVGLLGSGAALAPLIADTSLWFAKRRGIAVAVCASGNYVAGAIWPPVAQHFVEQVGWRDTYVGMGLFCGLTMAALALLMRARPPLVAPTWPGPSPRHAIARAPSACRPRRPRGCCAWRPSHAAWRWRCRRSTSSRTAATSATARHAARRCCR